MPSEAPELNQTCLGCYEFMRILEGCKSGLQKLISNRNYFIKTNDTVLHLGNNAKLTGQNKACKRE